VHHAHELIGVPEVAEKTDRRGHGDEGSEEALPFNNDFSPFVSHLFSVYCAHHD
jgi:hypothetical protein